MILFLFHSTHISPFLTLKKRHDPSNNRTVLLKCLLDIEDNVVCPIKLLLIHALRLGRVQGKSIDEVLSKALYIRLDKQIVWTDGQAPIFCAITSSGAGLLVDKPASNQQAKHFVAQAVQLCGVLGSIITHDIRRGYARDTAQIKSGINGLATSAVAATLGHTHQSHQRAVTAAYVGAIDDDVWAKRVNLKYEDPFGLQVAAQPPPKKPRLTKEEISTLCDIKGLDASDGNKRRQASKAYRADAAKTWIREEQIKSTFPREVPRSRMKQSMYSFPLKIYG